MEDEIILSIVVPAYNCKSTIARLLDSILESNINVPYEVILCDDNSTDNWISYIDMYMEDMNIIYTKNKYITHKIASVRQSGLECSSGKWVTFIDSDDMFYSNNINTIIDTLNKVNPTMMYCKFSRWDMNTNTEISIFKDSESACYLHGKFFNRQFIAENNIKFIEDMESQEDSYFCNVTNKLMEIKQIPIIYCDILSHKWVRNPNSFSEGYNDKYFYHEYHYSGDSQCITKVFEKLIVEYPDNTNLIQEGLDRFIRTLLSGYFITQISKFCRNGDYMLSNIEVIHNIRESMCSLFNITKYQIVEYAYSNTNRYFAVRDDCKKTLGIDEFIETQSFQEFILNI